MKPTAIALAFAAVLVGRAAAQDLGPVVSEAIVEAPPSAVWTAWTTGEGLRAWLAPHADIDLRLGGLMRTNYSQQGTLADPRTIENTILAFDPGRMLSIRVSKFPRDFPFPNAIGNMWTVIYFEPAGERQTRVRVVSMSFGADEESQKMRAFFERGNAVTLQQLQKHFARPAREKGQAASGDVVRAYLQAYNQHDVERMLGFLAPEFVWLSVTGDSVVVEARGVDALRSQMMAYFRRLPSTRSELEEVIALGPWVSARERAHWITASGPRSQASLSVYEVRDGLIRRVWYYPVAR
jgi:uncharacterized protein YndB with AHSA1/START domain/ketosteroid isomerase-like protein